MCSFQFSYHLILAPPSVQNSSHSSPQLGRGQGQVRTNSSMGERKHAVDVQWTCSGRAVDVQWTCSGHAVGM